MTDLCEVWHNRAESISKVHRPYVRYLGFLTLKFFNGWCTRETHSAACAVFREICHNVADAYSDFSRFFS